MKTTNELEDLSHELEAYLDLKLIGFRREYPEEHCIVQTAVRLREKVRANARRMADAAQLAEALQNAIDCIESSLAEVSLETQEAMASDVSSYRQTLAQWEGAKP